MNFNEFIKRITNEDFLEEDLRFEDLQTGKYGGFFLELDEIIRDYSGEADFFDFIPARADLEFYEPELEALQIEILKLEKAVEDWAKKYQTPDEAKKDGITLRSARKRAMNAPAGAALNLHIKKFVELRSTARKKRRDAMREAIARAPFSAHQLATLSISMICKLTQSPEVSERFLEDLKTFGKRYWSIKAEEGMAASIREYICEVLLEKDEHKFTYDEIEAALVADGFDPDMVRSRKENGTLAKAVKKAGGIPCESRDRG